MTATTPYITAIKTDDSLPQRLPETLTDDPLTGLTMLQEQLIAWQRAPFIMAKADTRVLYHLFKLFRTAPVNAIPSPLQPVVSDTDLSRVFSHTKFGLIDGNLNAQRHFLTQACLKSLAGWWNGHTAFSIVVCLGLVTDTKPAELTQKGVAFVLQSVEQAIALTPATAH